ncbi:hypothetical protein [Cellulomonas composti]|uniref:DZANK-type domain-containing protein n=1 Tax=Cellulomonas composti TaxID=266130 RepID=A0A511JAN3_9CELL|nr:hypothetical protein [Cellulomonas composti]GEL95055.1 hypothetical protein CCO02nite_17130 [Cellulomonas composti]
MTDLDATGDMLQVTCPECGTVSAVRATARLASDFCPSCDYPLFWARPQSSALAEDESDDARWRAPGASGSVLASTLACPSCAELNSPTAVTCVRCGESMTPPPPAPVPAPPAPQPVVVVQAPPEQIPCDHPDTWWVVVLTATVSVAVTLLIVWLV